MGRAPCCSKVGMHRGPWTSKEDSLLTNYITAHGEGHWRSLPKQAGLLRCGKSCRLRWMNYLRPDIKRGNITAQEDDLIIRLHSLLGNRWSLIAGRLPGRTDNEIKNYWNTRLSKKIPSSPSPPQRTTIPKKPSRKQYNTASEVEIIETKQHLVHQPKPVKLGSMIRNMSNLVQTSESTNNNNNSNKNNTNECGSFSSGGINDKSSTYYSNNNTCSLEEGEQEVEHVANLGVAFYNISDHGAWGDDMYGGLYGDEALVDDTFLAGDHNNSGAWERLYREYLHLTSDGC